MSEVLKINRSNIIDFLNDISNQVYGSVPIWYDNINDKEITDMAINTFNTVAGEDVYRQSPYRLDDKAHYYLSYVSQIKSGSLITIDDVTYMEDLRNCFDSGQNVSLKINTKLIPIAIREGKKLGLNSDYDSASGIVIFNKKGHNSVYRSIEKAMKSRERFFVAPKTVLSMKTARVYCSMIKRDNRFYSMQSISGGPDTYIWFDQPTNEERQMIDVKDMLYAVKDVIDKDELIDYFNSLYLKNEIPEPKLKQFASYSTGQKKDDDYDVRIDQDYFNNESEYESDDSDDTDQDTEPDPKPFDYNDF